MANPLGSAPGIMVGVGVGTAASVALEPIVEPGRQQAWKDHSNRVLDPGLMARLVAQGAVTLDVGREQAKREGLDEDKFDRIVYLEQHAPDLALTLELWRRGLFGPPRTAAAVALVDHALSKAQIETDYWPAIKELFGSRLDPALIATMVQRSILPNVQDPQTGQLILPNQPGTTDSNVPKMPQVDLDPLIEARAHGIDFDRLAAEARIVGLPASPDLAARMHFRKIITEGAFNQSILEGNTRGEWAPFLLDGFRDILTSGQYAELQLRGFLTPAERLANTDKHGMSKDDSDLLYNLLGRSIPVHQIITGEARGGTFDGPIDTIPKAILSSLQRGNLRPEFYNLAHANRYSYPSAFFFRLLLTQGLITAAEGEQAFLEIGWAPKWAKLIADALHPAGSTGATISPWVTKARNQLWAAIHRSFLNGELDRAGADSKLETLIPDLAARNEVLDLWTIEDEATTKPLTPANVKKAYKENTYTLDESVARLVAQQWAPADAQVYLQS